MFGINRMGFWVLVFLCLLSNSVAQAQSTGASTVLVTASAGNQQVRYLSIGEVNQTRLQVFNSAGAQVFDSDFKLGNLVNWSLQDQQGTRVADGSYLFVVTVKDFAGKFTQKYGTTNVDKDQLYLERTDRGDLPLPQSTALESNRQGESLSQVDRIGAGNSSSAADAQTSQGGVNSKPGVATKDAAANIVPSVAGAGSSGQLPKWIDGSGTLGDSIVTESSSNLGINTTTPGFLVDARSSSLSNATVAVSSTLGIPPDNVGFLAGVDASNRGRYDFSWRNSTGGLAIRNGSNIAGNIQFFTNSSGTNGLGNETEKVRIDKFGNLGVGTTTPAYPFDVRNGAIAVTDSNANTVTRLRGVGALGSQRGALELFDTNVLKTAFYSDGNNSFIGGGGNLGVGTTNPSYKLDVRSGTIALTDSNASPLAWLRGVGATGSQRGALEIFSGGALKTALYSDANSSFINGGGNFGIGTTNPQSKLDVVGDVNVTGNANITGNIAAKYQDVAEWVPAQQQMEAGTVVVLDVRRTNAVAPSTRPYDKLIAGVVSSRPGIILGEAGKGKVMVATTGRVLVNVDARRYPIKIGDLLVTSDKPGVAMRSRPIRVGGVLVHRPGTIVGKALESIARGQGKILVLLSLQ